MDTIFERLYSRDTMMDAEDELLALREQAAPRLEQLFDGTSRNEWGVPYRNLVLGVAIEVAIKLGPLAKPLENYIAAEVRNYNSAIQALGALGSLAPTSVEVLAEVLSGENALTSTEAAIALVKCDGDFSEPVGRAVAMSETAMKHLTDARRWLREG